MCGIRAENKKAARKLRKMETPVQILTLMGTHTYTREIPRQ